MTAARWSVFTVAVFFKLTKNICCVQPIGCCFILKLKNKMGLNHLKKKYLFFLDPYSDILHVGSLKMTIPTGRI